jgi:FixJ family two-component response regulator
MSVPTLDTADAPKILLVDDEQRVLDGLAMHLRRNFTVLTATSGAAGLVRLSADGAITVLVSDMRMPTMNGATFLARARAIAPTTVRMMLTGQADIASAIAAINDGQIFRFLTKPIAPPNFLAAVTAALAQHRLIVSEKVLLEQTLRGSLRTMTEILALSSPEIFGRATRISQVVKALMEQLSVPESWQIDVAVMLLPLAQISLSPETAAKMSRAAELTTSEQRAIDRLPELTDQLLANIPRLETVRVMLARAQDPFRPANCTHPESEADLVSRGAALIRVAAAFDALQQSGLTAADVISNMLAEPARFDEPAVQALQVLYGQTKDARRIQQVAIQSLHPGMILAEDLFSSSGMLLVARGFEVTPTCLERLRNFKSDALHEKIWVALGPGTPRS